MKYLMFLQVKYCRLDDDHILIESAFWHHVLIMKERLSEHSLDLSLALIEVDRTYLQKQGSGSVMVAPKAAGVRIISILGDGGLLSSSKIKKALSWPRLYKRINGIVAGYDVVHTGLSYDIYLPSSFMATLCAISGKKKLVYVVDIDFRNSSKMLYRSGDIGLVTHFLNTVLYDPLKLIQLRIATKKSSVAFLKGEKFAKDYSGVDRNVLPFWDTVHDISSVSFKGEVEFPGSDARLLRLVYFGRVVKYKGIQDAFFALKLLDDKGKGVAHCKLTIIGAGDYLEELKALAIRIGIEHMVEFKPPLAYGEQLFEELRRHDFLIALPQREDTPRSAFDAMACGLAIIAYDTYYYRELSVSGAVSLIGWRDVNGVCQRIEQLASDGSQIQKMSRLASVYAQQNTQSIWIEKRLHATLQALALK